MKDPAQVATRNMAIACGAAVPAYASEAYLFLSKNKLAGAVSGFFAGLTVVATIKNRDYKGLVGQIAAGAAGFCLLGYRYIPFSILLAQTSIKAVKDITTYIQGYRTTLTKQQEALKTEQAKKAEHHRIKLSKVLNTELQPRNMLHQK